MWAWVRWCSGGNGGVGWWWVSGFDFRFWILILILDFDLDRRLMSDLLWILDLLL